ncbi:hypothetical protein A0U87_11810 [Sphingobium sp. MP9-4]|nr:hypothetical protein A0U87_11810 [Sphingobium sp. MP9-4]
MAAMAQLALEDPGAREFAKVETSQGQGAGKVAAGVMRAFRGAEVVAVMAARSNFTWCRLKVL